MPSKEKLLLTGGSGFLGKALRSTLSSHYTITTLGRSTANNIKADLSTGIPDFDESFDIILHNAGKAHIVPRTNAEKEAFFKVNVEGTKHLLRAIEQNDGVPKSFIFISTIAVYGKDSGTFISEEHPLEGTTPYALSKIQAEQLIKVWCEQRGIPYVFLRLPLIVGPQAPGNLGAIIKAIQNNRYAKIKGNEAKKSAVLAEDVAQLIPNIIGKTGIYNLTDGQHPSFAAIESAIAASLDKKIAIQIPLGLLKIAALGGDLLNGLKIPFPLHSERLRKMTATLTFSDEKARKELKWNPNSVITYIQQGKAL